jgi:nucleotide-binding universal stress UspA family protein
MVADVGAAQLVHDRYMETDHPILAAYDASSESDDGLALAQLLGRLTDSDLLVVRVMEDMVQRDEVWQSGQRRVRERMQEARRALVAAIPGQEIETMPVLDPLVSRALHEIAESESATLIVLGSSHRHGVGRVLLGGSAESVVNEAPCPVAVAPPAYAAREPTIDWIVSAYDGSPTSEAAIDLAADLALVGRLPLQVVTVRPSLLHRRLEEVPDATTLERGIQRAEELVQGRVEVGGLLLAGDPGRRLSDQGTAGLLVMGSHRRGPMRRALLGSVSTHVMRHARQPAVIVPVPDHRAH